MCGVFGLVRNPGAAHPDQASAVFAALGVLAEERGLDAAGFAVTTGDRAQARPAWPGDIMRRQVSVGAVSVVKDTVPFSDLWDDDQHLPMLAQATVVLGHTRWATQGNAKAVANASPLLVGTLVATHNGDVDVRTITGHLPAAAGDTDTERLYQALDRDRRDRRKMTKVLRGVHGRAALAWIDQDHPDRVYLARAALSPLAIAFDADGNLYWASNPQWFRQVEEQHGWTVGFRDISLVREGSLLTVLIGADGPIVDNIRTFAPTCRARDARLADAIVWRGFTAGDIAIDKAQQQHLVAPAPAVTKTTAPVAAKVALPAAHRRRAAVPAQRPAGRLEQAVRAEQPELWTHSWYDDDDAWGQPPHLQDEVDQAMMDWLDEGCSPTLARRFRDAVLPTEQTALAGEFGFSCRDAVNMFRAELQAWTVHHEQRAG
jgi:glucosamine--fructose-6-phosphate aminotransferase (isomerizing)